MKTKEAVKHFGTQQALADAIGRSQGTIGGWGEYPPLAAQIDIEVVTRGALKAELTDAQRAVLAGRRRPAPAPKAQTAT